MRDSLAPKIETIQDAIGDRHLIKFQYYAPTGEGDRTIEPYYLVFRWSSWYLWGWCTDRKDYRLFKLNRMEKVEEFGPHCFTEADDGRLLFTADYTDMENLVTWLMTFGAKAEVLEPAEARNIIRRNAEETLQIYKEN